MKKLSVLGGACAILASAFLVNATPSQAAVVETFDLFSHPDGAKAPPAYGLRLDKLGRYVTGGGSGSSAWTFNFDAGVGSAMTLDHDLMNNTIVISGTAFGGRDTGSDYSAPAAQVSINFTYTDVTNMGAGPLNDNDTQAAVMGAPNANTGKGTGYIEFVTAYNDGVFDIAAGTRVNLVDKSNGSGAAFLWKSDNHRLSCGNPAEAPYCGLPVGRGWLAFNGASLNGEIIRDDMYNAGTQDFLFVDPRRVVDAPEPGTLALLGLGVLGAAVGRRRAKTSTSQRT